MNMYQHVCLINNNKEVVYVNIYVCILEILLLYRRPNLRYRMDIVWMHLAEDKDKSPCSTEFVVGNLVWLGDRRFLEKDTQKPPSVFCVMIILTELLEQYRKYKYIFYIKHYYNYNIANVAKVSNFI